MRPSRRSAVVALMLLLLSAPSSAPAADASAPGSQSYEIRLLGGGFTPPDGLTPGEVWTLQQRAAALTVAREGRIHVLLQMRRPHQPADRKALGRRGIDFGSFVPHGAWIASVPTDRLLEIAGADEVRWMTHWDAGYKLHPRVAAGAWGSWALDPSQPGLVHVFVQLHHDVPLDRVSALAGAHGGAASQPVTGLHGAVVRLPEERIGALAAEEEVLWIEGAPPPLSATNDGVLSATEADVLQAAPYGLDGAGVRLFVYDAGTVRHSHTTFDPGDGSRVTVIDGAAVADHATHVAGTAAGDGNGGQAKGVAFGADVLSGGIQGGIASGDVLFYDVALDIEADYATARGLGADLGNNSIGSNLASIGFPCELEGDYGVASNLLDGIVRGDNPNVADPLVLAWSNGNERSGGFGRCGANYVTTPPPSCAKNPIHVGAVNSDGGSMTRFSSWGPCDDGRLKPTVVAPGCEVGEASGENFVHSSLATSDIAFGGPGWCGTSMSSPAVAGMIALLVQDWRAQGHGGASDRPLPALVKAMLVQMARDVGQPGPDYLHGYGAVDAVGLIDLLRTGAPLGNSGAPAWGTDSVSHGDVDSFSVDVPSGSLELRVTLAWDDPAAAAFAADALVNDLDVEVEAPDGTLYSPWVLDPGAPHAPATTGVNQRDNQEQVVVDFPTAGTWTVRVRGASVPMGPQSYGLAYGAEPLVFDPALCVELVVDGGFEAGTGGWSLSGASRVPAPAPDHGSFSLLLGGATGGDQSATLVLSIPDDSSRAEASFWWYMSTDEADSHGFDDFILNVLDTSDQVLQTLDLRSDGWPQEQWMGARYLDLSAWAGQVIRLRFEGRNDAILPTSFYVDDVQLEACPASECTSEVITGLTVGDGLIVTREACDVLTAGPAVTVESGGDLTLRAGTRIVLRDGFRVENGGKLKLATGP